MNPGKCSIKADFLEHHGRKLFYLLLEPIDSDVQGSVLFLPPFAEEMHRSRHVVACQAREIAAAGYSVMLLDLTGCGDAGGDFSDASWQKWLQDAEAGAQALSNFGNGVLILWGLRLGALLAVELAQKRPDIARLLLWHPVLNGEQQIDQFLRLRTAAAAIANTSAFDRRSLWSELRSGRSLDVAGYELSPVLAVEMARARLSDLTPGCPVRWVEVGAASAGTLSIPSENVVAHWRAQGIGVETKYIQGDPFWRIAEVGINHPLQLDTQRFFSRR
ncbi:MAG: hydrolase 2, exosortase A system-associated [Halioglobus sp.]